ncbi:hypothetical protein OG765_29425 [Streptomyces sp. NBC_00555]|uniref:hypothetical protein n=1 Tax=Streptomyces sp. NBC_00555 TaxID=2903662 RepID=UPI00225BCFF8|nr:hypothetical protein [Streptomyces sp. NBC_00555]MCX5015058.1 hypothetical protein [Streptomyces sp. NBC_00555]
MKIAPLHPDGTECEPRGQPSGKPRDPASGCAGRRSYAVVCSACGLVRDRHGLRVLAEPAQTRHRDSHKTTLVPATR